MKKGIISLLSTVTGVGLGAVIIGKLNADVIDEAKRMSDKHLDLFLMMNQWVKVKQDGKNIGSFLEKNEYNKIAVYGMSYAGETFIHELDNTGIEIAYGIDKKADAIFSDIEVLSPDMDLEPVDAVIVTSISYFDEIVVMLKEKVKCPIISLEEILYEL